LSTRWSISPDLEEKAGSVQRLWKIYFIEFTDIHMDLSKQTLKSWDIYKLLFPVIKATKIKNPIHIKCSWFYISFSYALGDMGGVHGDIP